MSVLDASVVDAVGIERDSAEAVLTITDHLEWSEEQHVQKLQDKINSYFRFIESGEIFESYPQAKGGKLAISVMCLHYPNKEAIIFFNRASDLAATSEIGFRFRQLHFDSP